MGITSSSILNQSTQIDGSIYVSYRFEFHTGEKIEIMSRRLAVGTVVNDDFNAYAAKLETDIVESEDDKLITDLEKGYLADPLVIIPNHPDTDTEDARQKRFVRKLFRWAYKHADMKLIRRVFYPIWYYLKFDSGYTPTQIANYLNISIAKLSEVDTRFQAIHDNLAMINGDTPEEIE